MAMLLPGEVAMPLEKLRLAVPGLAGLVGFFVIPTLGGWFRLALETMEASRASLGRPRRVSTISGVRAATTTVLLSFFVLTLLRAAGELRDIESEAAVVGPSMQGMLVGAALWVVYGLGLSALSSDAMRLRSDRRMSSGLR